ncbi:type III-B CRISPR module RAMP protein Cmr1 [Haliangium ochraceum]|nr:type III-B CRISPR module RAMP protein Cmr1 [Haliangium ochraceum]
MIRMVADYELVTPAFIGGADNQTGFPELRVPSIKGALRFWWRALRWRQGISVAQLREQEARLFGSADSTIGRSRVSLALTGMTPSSGAKVSKRGAKVSELFDAAGARTTQQRRQPAPGLTYLGYGLVTAKDGKLERGCLRPPLAFQLSLMFDPRERQDAKALTEQLAQAMQALGLLGGLGARSRRGFGSVALRALRIDGENAWEAPKTPGELVKRIRALHGNDTRSSDSGPTPLPEWTALSARTRHLVLVGRPDAQDGTPTHLLEQLGQELVRFRSYGRNNKILGNETPERRFADDHHLFKDVLKGKRPQTHPRRAVFGLPHNYYSSSDRKGMQVQPRAHKLDRRGSPLLVHGHRCDQTPVLVLSFLPARFLPERRNKISVARHAVPLRPDEELWRPISEFLDRVRAPSRRDHLSITDAYEVPAP